MRSQRTIRLNSSPSIPIRTLRASILRDVSRSFYLSLRLLPLQLRDPISLAYLLARTTDTIADTAEIDVALRLERLRELAGLIQSDSGTASADSFGSFASLQKNAAERTLIEGLSGCLMWLHSLPQEDREDIQKVLAKITEGQTLDVRRFQNPAQVTALETAADLDRYTYLVAGSVGEFWTNICYRRLPSCSAQPRDAMLRWGIEYGKGLQLVNILRDAGEDLRAGRCYLPEEELRVIGLAPSDLQNDSVRADPVLSTWRERAERGIAAGIEYACAIGPRRVRLATVIPALIGTRTLALLRDAGSKVFTTRVKVERTEVRSIVLTLVAKLASPATIRAMHKTLSS